MSPTSQLRLIRFRTAPILRDLFRLDPERYIEYFHANSNTIIGEAEPAVIVVNATVHSGVAEDFPEMNTKTLSHYSPFLNPIANCFSVVKVHVSDLTHTSIEVSHQSAKSRNLIFWNF